MCSLPLLLGKLDEGEITGPRGTSQTAAEFLTETSTLGPAAVQASAAPALPTAWLLIPVAAPAFPRTPLSPWQAIKV